MKKTVSDYINEFDMHDFLGEGAYIGKTEWSIVLFTTDGLSITNEISFDIETSGFDALSRFIRLVSQIQEKQNELLR